MNRRIWTGILAGVLAATVLLGVAGAAFHAGQTHEVVTRTVEGGDVVRVVGGDYGGYGYGGDGHSEGFFLFPLFTIVAVFLLFRGLRGGGRGRWGGGYGGYGACGPGPSGGFEEHHRRAHEQAGTGPTDTGEA